MYTYTYRYMQYCSCPTVGGPGNLFVDGSCWNICCDSNLLLFGARSDLASWNNILYYTIICYHVIQYNIT